MDYWSDETHMFSLQMNRSGSVQHIGIVQRNFQVSWWVRVWGVLIRETFEYYGVMEIVFSGFSGRLHLNCYPLLSPITPMLPIQRSIESVSPYESNLLHWKAPWDTVRGVVRRAYEPCPLVCAAAKKRMCLDHPLWQRCDYPLPYHQLIILIERRSV